MAAITLQSDRLRLVVRPELGAGISDFSVKGPANYFHPMMRRASDGETSPSNLASFVMAPWANRLAGAAFAFGGRTHKLRATSSDGTAIHGDVRARPFVVLDRSPVSARLAFDSRTVGDANFPFPFEVVVRYEVMGMTATIEVDVVNHGSEPMPAGCGLHPYFMRRLWDGGEVVRIKAPVAGRYQLVDKMATGPAVPDAMSAALAKGMELPGEATDTVFGGCAAAMEINWPGSGVTLKMDGGANQRQVVLFVPHGEGKEAGGLPYFALEPQTNVNDGFNLVARGAMTAEEAGVAVVGAGERLRTRTVLEVQVAKS